MVTVVRLISPTTWVDRQIKGIQATGRANYLTGIETPKADPIQEAVKAKDKWWNQLQAAQQRDAFAQGLSDVTMNDWNANAKNIGADRLVDGVVRRQAKVQKFVTSFSPLLLNLLSQVDQMPTATASDRDAKAKAMADGLRALRGQW